MRPALGSLMHSGPRPLARQSLNVLREPLDSARTSATMSSSCCLAARVRLCSVQAGDFWSLVEQARDDVSAEGGEWPSGSAIGKALATRLAHQSAERIVEFQRCYERMAARSHQWAVCAAAYVIWGYISDDSFTDFKAGLVGLGREAFEQVVADADTLADHPMVQAIAAGQIDRFALPAEAIHFAASEACEQRSGNAEAFWDALEVGIDDVGDEDGSAVSERWSGRFGEAGDLARIRPRLTRLVVLFPERVPG